jgi:hypothetical protein
MDGCVARGGALPVITCQKQLMYMYGESAGPVPVLQQTVLGQYGVKKKGFLWFKTRFRVISSFYKGHQ